MLRVLQIVVAPKAVGDAKISSTGPERRAANLASRWADVGIEPVVCYPRRGTLWGEFVAAGINPIDFEIGSKFNAFAARQIAGIARRSEVDVIHAQGPASLDLLAVLGGRLAGRPVAITRPVMLDDQVMYSSLRRHTYRLIDELLTLKLAGAVVAVSEDGRSRLTAVSRVPARKMHLIHNGVRLQRFVAKQPSYADGKLDENPVTLGMVAQLFPPKAWDDFVRVIGRLRDDGLNVRGIIVGEGELRASLEQMVGDMGLADTISFAGFQQEVAKALQEFDIFLFTTKREGLSVAVIEAMASGLPVVATNVGGIAEQIEEGSNGFIVPAGDIDALADRAASLVTNPEKRARFSARSREFAESRFSEDRMLNEYASLYKRLANHGV